MTAFPKVAKLIREKAGIDICCGGGIIPDDDKPRAEKLDYWKLCPGTTLKLLSSIREDCKRARFKKPDATRYSKSDRADRKMASLPSSANPQRSSMLNFRGCI